jgi:hypothetical protein
MKSRRDDDRVVSLGKTRTRAHIAQSAVYACQRRSRGSRPVLPRPSGHEAPQSLAGSRFPGGRQILCSGIRIPCSGPNSALKFPATVRREFCKKTAQYQRFSHKSFARSGSNSQNFPANSLLAGNLEPETGSPETGSSATYSWNSGPIAVSAERPAIPGYWREGYCLRDLETPEFGSFSAVIPSQSRVAIFQCPGFLGPRLRRRVRFELRPVRFGFNESAFR